MPRKAQIAEDAWGAVGRAVDLYHLWLCEIARDLDLSLGEFRALEALDPDPI